MPFSQTHADTACNFYEKILKHTADEWWGKPFLLAPWEEEAVSTIFGTLDEDGLRVIQEVYLEVPKKSGKTEWAAGMVLLISAIEKTPGSQVYGAAASQSQALNVYRAACKMVEQDDDLKAMFRLLRGTNRIVKRSDPESFYAAIAADGDLTDGVNPLAVVNDELHRWKTRKQLENHDVLSLGGITRRQTLSINITTAGVQSDSPIAWRLHEKTLRIKQGIVSDPTFYGRIYAADPNDDWTKEETWIKSMPSLKQRGGFLDIGKIRKKYESSLADPESQRAFRRYYLNIWEQTESRCIDLATWDSLPRTWDAQPLYPMVPEDVVRPLHPDLYARFVNKPCYVGIDLSLTTDMSAVSFLFPDGDGSYDILPFFWLPEEGLQKKQLKDGMPYRRWAEVGWLETCKGEAISPRDIKERLMWGWRNFDVKWFCFDRYGTREISGEMMESGIPCMEVKQQYSDLNDPCKKFLELIAQKKIRHGAHPILRWNASCLSTQESKNDQMMWAKPQRNKETARIDGISATTDAMARAMLAVPESTKTVDVW